MSKKNLILIGFMGVGKGTVARELIRQSKYFGVDTDDLIESMENCKIKEIFETKGEPYFRALEQKTAKWLEKNVKKTIISTGGGFYNVKNLNEIGVVIYLESSFDAILQRIKEHPNAEQKILKRPLLKDIEKAKELFDQRVVAYEKKANLIVNVENKTPKQIATEILEIL
jgi:shikimate kinase